MTRSPFRRLVFGTLRRLLYLWVRSETINQSSLTLNLVGKEIIRFHCVYWPAFLLAAGLPLPKFVVAHGWLLFEESKMSKSRGNIVRTETILDGFGDHYRRSILVSMGLACGATVSFYVVLVKMAPR